MSLKALQDYTFVSKYARYLPELKRRETWEEAVKRVRDMHIRRYPQIEDDIKWAFDQVIDLRVLGSQRALQFGGSPIEKINERIYNCCFSYCDRLRFFQESLFLLLAGTGVGFSVQKHHIAKLPLINKNKKENNKVFIIPDSIQGWADSLGVLLSSYMEDPVFPEYYGSNVIFDFSQIRPKGSYLSSGVGKAPGPDPLKNSLNLIKNVLEHNIFLGLDKLRPIDAYDIIMHASDAVLSGGVRRSACLTIFSPDDEEMLSAKTGNWFYENPQRGRSNNSALLIRNSTTKEQFSKIMQSTKQFGEPGFIWADDTEAGFNPSLRKGTRVLTSDGIFNIEELENKEFFVKNLYGKSSPAKCVLSGKNKPLYKITLVGGKQYFATAEHKWPIKSHRNVFEKKETIQLKPGDQLPTITEFSLFDGEVGDRDDGFLVGWLYGDGWLTIRKDNGKRQYGFIVSKKDADNGILDKLNSIFSKKIGDVNWTKRKNGCFELNIQRQRADDYFSKFGVSFKKEGFPKEIWKTCSEDFRKGFIDGLLSADGSVNLSSSSNTTEICLSTSKSRMAEDFVDLLGFYGIHTTVSKYVIDGKNAKFPNGKVYDRKYEIFYIKIVGSHSLQHFSKLFSISHKSKSSKYQKWQESENLVNYHSFVKIKSVEKTNLLEDVWDISVYDETHCFQLSQCITGNCVEIELYAYDENGNSGFQFCNLTEINGKKIKDKEDFKIACRASAIIGTCQAGYVDFPYLGKVSEDITKREALLGCSITGFMENPDILLNPDIQREMAEYIKEVNAEIAPKIGVNLAARTTCCKPSGTTSCILGTSSGIHPHHARRYIRRVQANALESPLQFFEKFNPLAVEKSVWSATDSDKVINFCIEVPKGAKLKNELNAIDLLNYVKLTQQNWVTSGTRLENCVKPWLKHNVSNTCFTKDTAFITSKGIKKFSEFKDGDEVNVINYQGNFTKAIVKNFGEQEIWELIISDGKNKIKIHTTEGHVWLMKNKHTKYNNVYNKNPNNHLNFKMIKTYNLNNVKKYLQIPKVFANKIKYDFVPEAFCHGLIFGDGSKHYDIDSKTHIKIFDKCKKELSNIFEMYIDGCSIIDHFDHIYIGKLPKHWKSLPSDVNPAYLFNFISGWFAADGYITSIKDNQRSISLTSKHREHLEWLFKNSQICGIGVNKIKTFTQKMGCKVGEQYYKINFVKSTMSDEFFKYHPEKYQRWLEQKNKTQQPKYYRIISCEKTDRVEEVFCVVEPITNTFVLENNVLTHNCLVKPEEWEEVTDFIYDNREFFAGISLLPISGDKDYAQAPFTAIHTPREIVQMYGDGSLMASGLIVDGLHVFDDLWKACDCVLGIGEDLNASKDADLSWTKNLAYKTELKKDWVRRAKQFANKYFSGNLREMTWCLKDVNNWKTWCDLQREYRDVDYTELLEETDETKLQETIACAGGQCQLI